MSGNEFGVDAEMKLRQQLAAEARADFAGHEDPPEAEEGITGREISERMEPVKHLLLGYLTHDPEGHAAFLEALRNMPPKEVDFWKDYRDRRGKLAAWDLAKEDHDREKVDSSNDSGTTTSRFVAGGEFLLDCPDDVPAIWGAGGEVVWAEGESLTLAGPPGVGKTTIAGQVVRGRIMGGQVLGYQVRETQSRVLYLAMDRPQQIGRALRRSLRDVPREVLDERFVAWEGPPPYDVAKHPEALLALAREAGADTVVVDSLKDAALGLTDDEVGAGYNRARQLCLANGVQLLELHHMVKRGTNGSTPNTLADLYGSVWISAGSGSVVLLWGQAGDPIVSWTHLKQPAEEVGPFKVLHDHAAGESEVWHGADLLALARGAGEEGLTAKAAAVQMFDTSKPSAAQIQKARRKLAALARKGLVKQVDGDDAKQQPTVWISDAAADFRDEAE